jgi:hypothetical protein
VFDCFPWVSVWVSCPPGPILESVFLCVRVSVGRSLPENVEGLVPSIGSPVAGVRSYLWTENLTKTLPVRRGPCQAISCVALCFSFWSSLDLVGGRSLILCYPIVLPGRRKWVFRARFRPDFNQECLKIGPPAGVPILRFSRIESG